MLHIRTKITQSRWLPTIMLCVVIMARDVWAEKLPALTSPTSTNATTLTYQGQLSNADDTPVNATVPMTFALYDALTGGAIIWSEEHTDVPVNNGHFTVRLGSLTENGIPVSAWDGDRYLETTINTELLTPREPVRSPYNDVILGNAKTVDDLTVNGVLTTVSDLRVGGNLISSNVMNTNVPNHVLSFGNEVVTTDAGGYARVNYPWRGKFKTDTYIVVANNGDYNAGNFTVNIREKDADGFNVRLISEDGSVRANRLARIFYIAIGH